MVSNQKLICFTCAGGSKSLFNEIENDLPLIDVIKLDYSGHGSRYNEKLYQNFSQLADDMFNNIKDDLFEDYSLLGYSMGSITLVEVLKRIINNNLQCPKCIFIAAHEPHEKNELIGFCEYESDESIKKRTISFGLVDSRMLSNKPYWRTYLPIYRADYTMVSRYDFNRIDIKTKIPAIFFYSESDTPLIDMELWKQFFIGKCEFYSFAGTHFFIRQFHKEMAEIIYRSMA